MNEEPIKIDVSKIVPEGWRLVDRATEAWQKGDRWLCNGSAPKWLVDNDGCAWEEIPRIRRIAPPQPETVDVPIENRSGLLRYVDPNDGVPFAVHIAPCIVGTEWAFVGFVWEGHETRVKREYYKLSSDCERITYAKVVRFRRVKGGAK